jgi:hypothetical protein
VAETSADGRLGDRQELPICSAYFYSCSAYYSTLGFLYLSPIVFRRSSHKTIKASKLRHYNMDFPWSLGVRNSNSSSQSITTLPANILEAFIPGYSIISAFLLDVLGFDITLVVCDSTTGIDSMSPRDDELGVL